MNKDTIYRQDAIDALIKADYELTGILSEPRARMFEQTINALPPAEPEVKEIGYAECSDAMLKMWMDNVLTDGEYNRIMDKLNEYWGKVNA